MTYVVKYRIKGFSVQRLIQTDLEFVELHNWLRHYLPEVPFIINKVEPLKVFEFEKIVKEELVNGF